MKKKFTLDLITDIVSAVGSTINAISQSYNTVIVEEVAGVPLAVTVKRIINDTFMGVEDITLDIAYGEMVIATSINACALVTGVHQLNPLYCSLVGALGPQTERLDMSDIDRIIHRSSAISAIISGNCLDSTFSIKLPGDISFSRSEKSLIVKKGEDEIFNLTTTKSHLIDFAVQTAARLVLSLADPVDIPERTVDTSVKSYLFNGVLYQKTDDGEVSYVFEDERTHMTIARQRGPYPQHGTLIDPTQQYQMQFGGSGRLYQGFNNY